MQVEKPISEEDKLISDPEKLKDLIRTVTGEELTTEEVEVSV